MTWRSLAAGVLAGVGLLAWAAPASAGDTVPLKLTPTDNTPTFNLKGSGDDAEVMDIAARGGFRGSVGHVGFSRGGFTHVGFSRVGFSHAGFSRGFTHVGFNRGFSHVGFSRGGFGRVGFVGARGWGWGGWGGGWGRWGRWGWPGWGWGGG